MSKHLVIVESPTKAKTIQPVLGSDYQVVSSYGHVRDLPKSKLGVDTEKDFEPEYVIPVKARKTVKALKDLIAKSQDVILATDPDREGEAIAWHIEQIIKTKKPVSRISFHAITKAEILKALQSPGKINRNLVEAQQTRRILDRLFGYKLSPFLWKKVLSGLSAGRVQSPAVRLIVDREAEIDAFKKTEYWDVTGEFSPTNLSSERFTGSLIQFDGKKIDKLTITNEKESKAITKRLKEGKYSISKLTQTESLRRPKAPYTTSTLQQDSSNQLHFSAKKTMTLAQKLYEGIKIENRGQVGLITYMRTDSTNVSPEAISSARDTIAKSFGKNYLPDQGQVYKTKSKVAQEAHEAIRPTYPEIEPESIKSELESDQYRLYALIWSRFVASQAIPAKIANTTLDITNDQSDTLRSTGVKIIFDGFLKIASMSKVQEKILPELKEKDLLTLHDITPEQHFTEPPARYNEASLVKALEELGIGRPSTYASIIDTIQYRGYVTKEARAFIPTDIAKLVIGLLKEHFTDIIDVDFTAKMEDQLDSVANGEIQRTKVLNDFYIPFHKLIETKEKELGKNKITEEPTDVECDECKNMMMIKTGRYGKFLSCSNFPKCKNTQPYITQDINDQKAGHEAHTDLKDNQKIIQISDYADLKCPNCSSKLRMKQGRFGQFLACDTYPTCKYTQSINKTIGMTCPDCKKGDVVEKKTKRGKLFWGCSNYPKCKYASWTNPATPVETKEV
jgi:DNA topoisomerase-1